MGSEPASARGSSPRRWGQGLLEYSLILALTVIVVIVVFILMGRQIQHAFQAVVTTLQGP
jgi:Flp pilus assembly pilin Flp